MAHTRSTRGESRRLLRGVLTAAAAVALVAGTASAQQGAQRGRMGGTEGLAPAPIPSRGLSGVRAQAPRPLGSVPQLLPRATPLQRGVVGRDVAVPRVPAQVRRPETGFVRGPGGFVRRGDVIDPRAAFIAPGIDRRSRAFVTPQGFRAAAELRQEDFWLRLNLGSPGSVIQHGRHWVYPKPHTYLGPGPLLNQWPYGRRQNIWPVYSVPQWSWDPYYVVGPYGLPEYGAMSPEWAQAPLPTPSAPPPRELTPLERGNLLTAMGHADRAVESFRAHLADSPEDAAAMRSMAVALLKAGRPEQAVAVVAMAYEKEPEALAIRPISGGELFQSPEELRRTLNRAVTYANRVNTSSSWLLVAALMQAEGREGVAARMVDRAAEIGLSERIAGALMLQLRG